MIELYFNSDCSKCNTTECILTNHHITFNKIKYLNTALSKDKIKLLLQKLEIGASDLIRKSEPIFKEHFEGKTLCEEEWINAMIEYPILIERPILVDGSRAIICRPPEKLYEFLKIR